jgi:hypothetical protein
MREGLEGETYAGRYVVADARLASPVAAGEGTVVVRAGFARLSGWQPVGNWVASAANLSVGVTPTMIRRIATTVCAEKWPEAQAEQVAGVHVFSSQEGAETIPRDGAVFYTMTRSCPPQ